MYFTRSHLAGLVLSVSTARATTQFGKRDVSWGPIAGLYATTSEIISTTSTIYPGKMPQDQQGFMFAWIGIGADTGDLVQSIIGSYPPGQSECSGSNADTTWCITSEVYGEDDSGATVQFVGDKRTADVNYENGIVFNYTLIDKSTYTWEQTMTDAVTGVLLSTYQKKSGPMTLWNTAVELQDNNGVQPTGTIEPQYYVNSTIVLESADESYGNNMYTEYGAITTDMTTNDGGKTWVIEKITVPAMESSSDSDSSSSSSSAVVAAVSSTPSAVASSVAQTSAAVVAPASSASSAAAAAAPTGDWSAWGPPGQGQGPPSGGFGGW
ncbi:hypothetical protein VMCG_07519 [Cytospora schulzeri]|uniref:Uncharacterized protein n=1 Tax=Cytospora schulzeri TaxID=448051 RepID=A0A423W140_9PEZI|nr:hypothetical protein VMCG_07519 [Valsa malicola]